MSALRIGARRLIGSLLTIFFSVALIPPVGGGMASDEVPATRMAGNSVATSSQSQNWSGYFATGGTFTAVSAGWTATSANTSTRVTSAATWVGLGGVSSPDLIQVGTQVTTYPFSQPSLTAWIETLPSAAQTLPIVIQVGDRIAASITPAGPGQWAVRLTDVSTGAGVQRTISYASSESSAEWIVEDPSSFRGLVPLADFGTVNFTNATARNNGTTANLAAVDASPIIMVDSIGLPLATTSPVGVDGGSFSVTRSLVSSVPLPIPPNILFPIPGDPSYRPPRDIRS